MRRLWRVLLLFLSLPAFAASTTSYDLASFFPGVPGNSAIIRIGIPRAITLNAGLPNTVCTAREAATASTTVTLKKIHAGASTSIGTLVWSATGTVCAVTFTTAVNFAQGDILEEDFPSVADTTLGDITITIPGIRK